MRYFNRLLTSLFLILMGPNTIGSTLSGTLGVTVTVGGGGGGSCVFGSTRPMLFPPYNAMNPYPDEATGGVTVTCPSGLPYDVGARLHQGVDSSIAHYMITGVSGGKRLAYRFFRDNRYTHYLGGKLDKDTLRMEGTGLPQALTFYGQIAPHQVVQAGAYSDLVTIIVTF